MANETPWFDSAFVTGRARKDAEWEAERRSDQRGDDRLLPDHPAHLAGGHPDRPHHPISRVCSKTESTVSGQSKGPAWTGPFERRWRGQAGAIWWFARKRSAGSNARFTSRSRRYTEGV